MRQLAWRPNHGTEQPCRIVVYDTESQWTETGGTRPTQVHSLRLGCASTWKRTGLIWKCKDRVEFKSPGQFWSWLYGHCRKREPIWVYAHNAAFDATMVDLWAELDRGVLCLSSPGREYRDQHTGRMRQAKQWHGKLSVDNLPFIIEARKCGATIKFIDTMNYLPTSLEAISQWVGLKKVALPSNDDCDENWLARCWRDVEITEAALFRLMDLWRGRKLGNWQMTIAGLAYSSFRHTSPDSGIVAHGDEPATPEELADHWIAREEPPLDALDLSRLERAAYYGARVLTAFVGDVVPPRDYTADATAGIQGGSRPSVDGPVTVYDVNGLYAYCMAAYNGPVEFLSSERDVDVATAAAMAAEHPAIARVALSVRSRAYPVRADGRTIFARGTFETTLAGPELIRAFDAGHVARVDDIALYHRGRPFREYVIYWWDKRIAAIKDGDECTASLCKSMINALYGKLGQQSPVWQPAKGIMLPPRWGTFLANIGDGQGMRKFRSIAGEVQQEVERRSCLHTFTAASAWITSTGRCLMDDIREALPPRSVIYHDTDSLFLLPAGAAALERSGLVHPTEMGKLKKEATYDYLSIWGPKNYTADGRNVIAGLRSNADEIAHRRWKQWYFERCNAIVSKPPDGTLQSWEEVFASPGSAPGVAVAEDGWTKPVRLLH